MAKITANNIFTGAITSDKLDSSVASNLATANNANVVATIASTVAAAAFSTANNLSSILANSAPIITSITIADSSYNVLDDTAANTTGGFCIITGSGFVSTPTVVFGTTSAPAVSFINSTTLRAQIPALTAASYPVYVVNSNGGTAIRVNGLTTSSFPAWGTAAALANTAANTAFSVSLSANSDSNITYSNTTSLPAGTTLASNGYFSGTVSIGTQTTYTFDVKATDVENQDANRTFSLTVTVAPQYKLYSWGDNSNGSLGLNSVNPDIRSSPSQVGSDINWNIVKGGKAQGFMAIKSTGTLWGWGYNFTGRLGVNDNISKSSPTQVGTNTNWSDVSASSHTLAIKTDGTLWSWGEGYWGTLGINSTAYRSSPTQVGTGTNWNKISTGLGFSIATQSNGTLWTWGNNPDGQLGLDNTINRSSPVQVGTGTTWLNVAAGMYHILATKTDGTLWAWGRNQNGQLGDGTTISRVSPVQIAGTTWSSLASNGNHNIVTKTDGTLWLWGKNNYGTLGLNDRVDRSSPVQLGALTNWSNVIANDNTTSSAIKTDGTLWTWGNNNNGNLGLNDTAYRSSPVQVGTGTNWYAIAMTGQKTIAVTNS